MTVFQNVLDPFYGSGALDASNWGQINGYTLMTRSSGAAIPPDAKSGMYWKGFSAADSSVGFVVNVGDGTDAAVIYRLTTPTITPAGYMMKFEPSGGNIIARLYLMSDTTTPIGGPVTVKVGSVAYTSDWFGVAFSGSDHEVWYKPSGGAAALKGTITDSTILTAGFVGFASGANI